MQDIDETEVTLCGDSGCDNVIPNDNVFVLIGREAPLDFFRRSGIHISGERTTKFWLSMAMMLLFCIWLYHWKKRWRTALRRTFSRMAQSQTK